jgi:hypothetical protein
MPTSKLRPRPATSQLTSTAMHLPFELLQHIFLMSCSIDAKTTSRLRAVSRTSKRIVNHLRFQTIQASGERALVLLLEQLERASIRDLEAIRHVYLSDTTTPILNRDMISSATASSKLRGVISRGEAHVKTLMRSTGQAHQKPTDLSTASSTQECSNSIDRDRRIWRTIRHILIHCSDDMQTLTLLVHNSSVSTFEPLWVNASFRLLTHLYLFHPNRSSLLEDANSATFPSLRHLELYSAVVDPKHQHGLSMSDPLILASGIPTLCHIIWGDGRSIITQPYRMLPPTNTDQLYGIQFCQCDPRILPSRFPDHVNQCSPCRWAQVLQHVRIDHILHNIPSDTSMDRCTRHNTSTHPHPSLKLAAGKSESRSPKGLRVWKTSAAAATPQLSRTQWQHVVRNYQDLRVPTRLSPDHLMFPPA